MANIIRELTVCEPCMLLNANGEVAVSHEDVSERYAALQVATLGKDAGYLVLAGCDGEDAACRAGECDCQPSEAIGTCDACGTEPATGYWFGYRAVIIR